MYCQLEMCGWLGKLKKAEFGGHVTWSVLKCCHSAPDLQMWTSIPSQPVSFVAIIKIHSFFKCFTYWFVVQSLKPCPTLCSPMDCSMPGFPVFCYLPELTQTHVHWVSDPPTISSFCNPLLLLLPIFPIIRVFSSELALCIRWPKYWGFSCSISPSSEYSRLISFGIDWFDLLQSRKLSRVFSSTTVQKHQFLDWHPGLFMVQLSHPYMSSGKNHSFD